MSINHKQLKKWPKAVMKKYLKVKDSKEFKIVFAVDDVVDLFYIYIKPTGGHYKDQEHILSFATKSGTGKNTKYFPFHAPKVKFLTSIYHPNISIGGSICVDILTDNSKWSPSYDFSAVMSSILLLMEVPNNASPYNKTAADLFINCNKTYNNSVNSSMNANERSRLFDVAFKVYADAAKKHADAGINIFNKHKHLFMEKESIEEKTE